MNIYLYTLFKIKLQRWEDISESKIERLTTQLVKVLAVGKVLSFANAML